MDSVEEVVGRLASRIRATVGAKAGSNAFRAGSRSNQEDTESYQVELQPITYDASPRILSCSLDVSQIGNPHYTISLSRQDG